MNQDLPEKKKSRGWLFYILVFLVFSIVIGGINNFVQSRKTPEEKSQDSLARQQEVYNKALAEKNVPNATRDIEITKDSWEKGGFGSVGLHSFTIVNKSDKFGYKDIVVLISYYGESGTEIGNRRQTVYKQVKPKGKTRISDLNTGFIDQQAKSASVVIESADQI